MLYFFQSDFLRFVFGHRVVDLKPKQAKIDPILWKALNSPFDFLFSLFFDWCSCGVFHQLLLVIFNI